MLALLKLFQEWREILRPYRSWLRFGCIIVMLLWFGGWGWLLAYGLCVKWGFNYRVSLYKKDIHDPELQEECKTPYLHRKGDIYWYNYVMESYEDTPPAMGTIALWFLTSCALILYAIAKTTIHITKKNAASQNQQLIHCSLR